MSALLQADDVGLEHLAQPFVRLLRDVGRDAVARDRRFASQESKANVFTVVGEFQAIDGRLGLFGEQCIERGAKFARVWLGQKALLRLLAAARKKLNSNGAAIPLRVLQLRDERRLLLSSFRHSAPRHSCDCRDENTKVPFLLAPLAKFSRALIASHRVRRSRAGARTMLRGKVYR